MHSASLEITSDIGHVLKRDGICLTDLLQFLARDVIYTSRAYATMIVSVCLSVCL